MGELKHMYIVIKPVSRGTPTLLSIDIVLKMVCYFNSNPADYSHFKNQRSGICFLYCSSDATVMTFHLYYQNFWVSQFMGNSYTYLRSTQTIIFVT